MIEIAKWILGGGIALFFLVIVWIHGYATGWRNGQDDAIVMPGAEALRRVRDAREARQKSTEV